MITLDEVKTYLGIETALYNTQISRYIPIVTSKVIQIGNHGYNTPSYATVTNESNSVLILDDSVKSYFYGCTITGTGIPAGAYVTQVYTQGAADGDLYPSITISANATESATERLYIGAPIDLKVLMSQLVWWFIGREDTGAQPKNSVASKSVNGISVSYSGKDSEIDNVYGVPSWFSKAIPVYASMG